MKVKFLLPVILCSMLTACASVTKDPIHNPQGLNNDDLIKTQIAKMEQMQREMEKREAELKYQHLKEMHQMQSKQQLINTNCKFICF